MKPSDSPLWTRWRYMRQEAVKRGVPCDFATFPDFAEYVTREVGIPEDPTLRLYRKVLEKGWVAGNLEWGTRHNVGDGCADLRVIVDGELHCIAHHARHYGINRATAYSRLQRGWDADRAFKTPAHTNGRQKISGPG